MKIMVFVVNFLFSVKNFKNFKASQPVKLEFTFDGAVPDKINYALLLTNELVIVNSDGQRRFDWM